MLSTVMNGVTSLFAARLSYLVMVVTVIVFAAFYLHTFFYLILALLIALPFFSYNINRYAFSRIKPSMHFLQSSCKKGESTFLELEIVNSSHLPISSYEITIDVHSLFYGSTGPRTHSIQLSSGRGRLSFPIKLEKYGVYTASATYHAAFDHLHLFRFSSPLDIGCSVTVMPDADPKEKRHDIIYEEGFDEFTDNSKRGYTSGNVTDIREYRPGDKLSRIHWKLTGKLDKLIVKENESVLSNEFTVLLELYQPSEEECLKIYADSGNTDDSAFHILDDALEEAWAVSVELLQAGFPFMFMFYDHSREEFTEQLINSRDDLEDIFTRAFYAGSYDVREMAYSVYERAGLNKGTLIHVK